MEALQFDGGRSHAVRREGVDAGRATCLPNQNVLCQAGFPLRAIVRGITFVLHEETFCKHQWLCIGG